MSSKSRRDERTDAVLTHVATQPVVSPRPPAVAAQRHSAPIARQIGEATAGAFEKLEAVQEKLAASERKWNEAVSGGKLVIEIEPDRIIDTNWRDRDERALGLDDTELLELVRSIEAHGQRVPITVRPSKAPVGKYEIVVGHRRHRACMKLGRSVKAIVEDMSDLDLVVQMEVENSVRRDLSVIEKARKYRAFVEGGLMNQAQIADRFGYSQGLVAQLMSINEIPHSVVDALGTPLAMSKRQGLLLVRAMRDESLYKRALEQAAAVADSGLSLEQRIAFLRGRRSSLTGPGSGPRSHVTAEYKNAHGRVVLALAQQDERPVIRFPPDADEDFVRFVWERLAAAHEEYERQDATPAKR
jgi:ParB family transcriptional regulator, chromosome partitioning protein